MTRTTVPDPCIGTSETVHGGDDHMLPICLVRPLKLPPSFNNGIGHRHWTIRHGRIQDRVLERASFTLERYQKQSLTNVTIRFVENTRNFYFLQDQLKYFLTHFPEIK
ncbi:hypothetical protein WA026_008697 [Henosepilachna vigintioctopunctata]|uniref:Uncharacterized protein n=1 Tax=Henosepilachna vigintioctopunctata TaxID=420089 RepID=A0AAW1V3Q3_9CUCU